DIQAAVVCLPHHLHQPVSCQIMETVRHVLVEKPWAIGLAEGKEMLDKAREKGVILMAGQSFRFMWALWEAKQRVVQGDIGDPFNLLYIFAAPFTKATAPPWWQDVEKTGGMAFTMYGAHTIDYTLWIYEGRKPVRVYAEARSINPDFKGMDEIIITIRFDDDSMATNILSINTKPTKHECLIVGPKGRIDVVQRGGHVPGQLVGVFSGDLLLNGELVRSDAPKFHQFAAQMREFLEAISQKREPIVKYSQMLAQLAIIDAAKQSADAHQPVLLS
ncbi:MAG: Gfo/Idh/MocA family oxidoreductase, partial [Desulfobacterales bacterium]|nr:Gfo/Idh/MocA family oxidoreductase [Desulfobacterales bacterium]